MVLSVGADGRFAGLVIPELIRRGASVRGLVHKPKNAREARNNGASEVVIGDLRDPQTLESALKGVSRVFYIAPAFAPDESQLGLNLISAARQAGVRRFVFSSVIHPALELENHSAKIPVEAALYSSGMEFVILQPATFFQNFDAAWPAILKTGVFAEPFSKTARIARVDFRDVAEVAALALLEDRLVFGTFELCADGMPNREDIARIMSDILGRTIQAAEPTFEEWAAKARPPHDQTQPLKKMYEFYGAHGAPGNSLTLRAILGRGPRTLRDYIAELAGQGSLRLGAA